MISQYDIAVAVRLVEEPHSTYGQLACSLQISGSTAFNSVRQLEMSGLLFGGSTADGGRRVNRLALLEFLEHGLRYVFPAALGAIRLGVPTAHSSPVLAQLLSSESDECVWASKVGTVRGRTIEPLIPSAPLLATSSPGTYEILTLIDSLRVGQVRERKIAIGELRQRFGAAAGVPAA